MTFAELQEELGQWKYDKQQAEKKLDEAKQIADPDERKAAVAKAKAKLHDAKSELIKVRTELSSYKNKTGKSTKDGAPKPIVLINALKQTDWKFQFNEMTLDVLLDGKTITDADIYRIGAILSASNDYDPGKEDMWNACHALAVENPIHPLREDLLSEKWDGEKRIHRVVTEILRCKSIFGAFPPEKQTQHQLEQEEEALRNTYICRWMLGAIERLFRPGCKMDNALVFAGGEGIHKSSFFGLLCGSTDHFSDAHLDLNRMADVNMQTRGKWIIEWAELSTKRRARDEADVKEYVSRQIDSYRVPYARSLTQQPRTFVLAGTSNPSEILTDEGGRRYFLIQLEGAMDLDLLSKWRKQLWAEAIAIREAARTCTACAAANTWPDKRCEEHRWWMDAAEQAVQMRAHNAFREEDSWDDKILTYIKKLGPSEQLRTGAMLEALGVEIANQDRPKQNRLGGIMRRLGYKSVTRTIGTSRGKCWVKQGDPEGEEG